MGRELEAEEERLDVRVKGGASSVLSIKDGADKQVRTSMTGGLWA